MPRMHIDFTGDNKSIVATVNDTVKRLESLSDAMKAIGQGDNMDLSSHEKSLLSLQRAIIANEEVMRDYKSQLEKLYEKQRAAAESGDVEAVKKYGEEMKTLSERLQETTNETKELKEGFDELNGTAEKGESVFKKLLGGTQNINDMMTLLPDPIKRVVSGMNGMVKAAMKFIATPLGMVLTPLILAFNALYTWLNKSAEGQQKLAKITGYLTGFLNGLQQIVMDVGKKLFQMFDSPKEAGKAFLNFLKGQLVNRLEAIGKIGVQVGSILKNALSLKFDEAKKDAAELGKSIMQLGTGVKGDAIIDTVKHVNDVAKAESDLNARRQKLHIQRTAWQTEEAEYDRKITEQRNKMYSGTQAQRKKAAEELQRLVDERTAKELAMATEEYEIKKASNALTDSSQEDLDEEARLQAQIIKIQTRGEQQKGRSLRTQSAATQSLTQQTEKLKEIEERRLELSKQLGEAAAKAERESSNLKIMAMEDGFEKEKAELEAQQKERLVSMKKAYDDQKKQIEKLQKAAYKIKHGGSSSGFAYDYNDPIAAAAKEQYDKDLSNELAKQDIENEKLEKRILDSRNANRWAYLQAYGNYREQELAITEKYNDAIAKSEDDYEKKALERQKQSELYNLKKANDGRYAFIFASAASLTDTELSKAIEYTQEAIKEATDSNDIQALTELYKKLREQMGVQGDRNRGFGISSIRSGISLLNKASYNRYRANELTDIDAQYYGKEIAKQTEEAANNTKLGLKQIAQGAGEVQSSFSSIASMMTAFGDDTDGWRHKLHEVGSVLGGIAKSMDVIKVAFKEGATDADKWSSAISAGVQIFNMVASQIGKNIEAEESWNKLIDSSAHKLAMLRIEEKAYKQSNIFGVEDPFKKATDSADAYFASMEEIQKITGKLANGKVQTGQNWGLNGKNALQGAALGAAAGSIIPGIGTAVGAAVGGAIGLVAGALSGEMKPVMATLASQYGELFNDETYELNPQIIADYEKLDDETKKIVDNWDDIREKALKAQNDLKSNLSSFSGDIGNQLRDSLIGAWKNRNLYAAIDDFKNHVNDSIANILEQKAFASIYQSLFDELEQRMTDSFLGEKADNDITDDLAWLDSEYPKRMEYFDKAMTQAQETMEKMGYAGFNGTSTNTDASRAVTSSVTESTASAIEGRLTAIQIAGQIRTDAAMRNIEYISSIRDMLTIGGETLSNIRDMHILEVSYLADIAKQTKPILGFRDILDSIRLNTSRL